jgi:hypothetical protein
LRFEEARMELYWEKLKGKGEFIQVVMSLQLRQNEIKIYISFLHYDEMLIST